MLLRFDDQTAAIALFIIAPGQGLACALEFAADDDAYRARLAGAAHTASIAWLAFQRLVRRTTMKMDDLRQGLSGCRLKRSLPGCKLAFEA